MGGRAPDARGEMFARGRRFAIVASRFHEEITTRLVEGARDALQRHGAADRDLSVVWVPGAFEIPQVAMRLARRGAVDALVCLGCVIRGETPHFEYVAGEAARGIAEVGRLSGVPTTFGVITAETTAQAVARAGGKVGNRGAEAALAALELVRLVEGLDVRGTPRARSGRGRRQGRSDGRRSRSDGRAAVARARAGQGMRSNRADRDGGRPGSSSKRGKGPPER